MESHGIYVTEWVSCSHFCLAWFSFRTTLPCSDGYNLTRGGNPLHDAVGINCKKAATNENQEASVQ